MPPTAFPGVKDVRPIAEPPAQGHLRAREPGGGPVLLVFDGPMAANAVSDLSDGVGGAATDVARGVDVCVLKQLIATRPPLRSPPTLR